MNIHGRRALFLTGLMAIGLWAWSQVSAQTSQQIPAKDPLRPADINSTAGVVIPGLPYTISSCGRYVLTHCLSGVSGQDGITVSSDDVTIDLNGYTISGAPGSLNGITVTGAPLNVVVENGAVVGWGRVGLNLTNSQYCRVERIHARGNTLGGIQVGRDSLVSQCISASNVGDGLTLHFGSRVRESIVQNNGGRGIAATGDRVVIADCTANDNIGNGIDSLSEGIVRCCLSVANDGIGMNVGDTCIAENSVATSNNSHGIMTNDRTSVRWCVSGNNGGDGIRPQSNCYVAECIATNNTSYGIEATSNEDRLESNHILENGSGGIRLLSCGALVTRNSAGNGLPGNCPANNLDSLFNLGSDSNTGIRTDQPGDNFTRDPWANIGL